MTLFGKLPLLPGIPSRDRASNTGAVIADMARTTETENALHFRAHEGQKVTLFHSTCTPPRYVPRGVQVAISVGGECSMAERQRHLAFTEV